MGYRTENLELKYCGLMQLYREIVQKLSIFAQIINMAIFRQFLGDYLVWLCCDRGPNMLVLSTSIADCILSQNFNF